MDLETLQCDTFRLTFPYRFDQNSNFPLSGSNWFLCMPLLPLALVSQILTTPLPRPHPGPGFPDSQPPPLPTPNPPSNQLVPISENLFFPPFNFIWQFPQSRYTGSGSRRSQKNFPPRGPSQTFVRWSFPLYPPARFSPISSPWLSLSDNPILRLFFSSSPLLVFSSLIYPVVLSTPFPRACESISDVFLRPPYP